MALPVPKSVQNLFSKFPLQTYPAIERTTEHHPEGPTLWVLPPDEPNNSVLSSDVECLKWQAYIALWPRDTSEGDRKDVKVAWDISPAAGVDGMLPTLCIQRHNPKSGRREWKFLGSKGIAEWIDGPVELQEKDTFYNDEMEAWVQLLEGDVHDALVVLNESHNIFDDLRSYLLPGRYGKHGPVKSRTALVSSIKFGAVIQLPFITDKTSSEFEVERIRERFSEAIKALSVRLGGDEWFLGSRNPTALDALAFAYICKSLHESNQPTEASRWIRREVWKYVNLIRWETRVRKMVEAFYR